MTEKLQQGGRNHEVYEVRWHILFDHLTSDGGRLIVYENICRRNVADAYTAVLLSQDGTAKSLTVTGASDGVNESRRWNRQIVFDDESYIEADIQRFEVRYHRDGREELLVPISETLDL